MSPALTVVRETISRATATAGLTALGVDITSGLMGERQSKEKDWTPVPVDVVALPKRGLTKETCEAWGYGIGETTHGQTQVATYRDERGQVVAQKLRLAGKRFAVLGSGRDMPLYGVWKFGGGKHLVITEGEIDALSVSQAMDNKWPVVSLPNGAQSAAKAIANCYDWLDRFERMRARTRQSLPRRRPRHSEWLVRRRG
jgi:twinkle protein